ncbi:unnamed protein product [Pleuronectes platessa]|uniref:Uncharacterized protein n=1 Tax=Pleuronectes platessa TaxID=8262 RepID=A0A9N7ZBY4_PLEPL|nr:unnamed protein product [Pleuronectes platessa]
MGFQGSDVRSSTTNTVQEGKRVAHWKESARRQRGGQKGGGGTPTQTEAQGADLWKHAPDYLDLMCEQRFGSPLFGLVSHEVPKRNGLNMTSSGRTKDGASCRGERESGEVERGGLQGAGDKDRCHLSNSQHWSPVTSDV